MWLTNSSVGRKVVMSVTGLFLILFLTFHALMNAVALIRFEYYEAVCEFLGANWYALVGTAILAAGFLLHIVFAFWLTWQNRRARGNNAYEMSRKPATVEWASQNMLALGIVVLCFIVLHLAQFWAKMQLPELFGIGNFENNPYLLLTTTFGKWWVLLIYIIWFVAIFLHLSHGFWSMFQSVGWNNQTWMKRLKVIGIVVAALICLMFLATAVNAFLQAHGLIG